MGVQKKLLFASLPVVLMILALPIYVLTTSNSQENRSRASEEVPNEIAPSPTTLPEVESPQTTNAKGDISVGLTLKLHGIGIKDETAAFKYTDNNNPLHSERKVEVTVHDTTGRSIAVSEGTVTYNSTKGTFQGKVFLGPEVKTGEYLLKVKTERYLRRFISNVQLLKANADNNLPELELIAGDITNDNAIDLSDLNVLIACYGNICSEDKKIASDLNDDGVVNQNDFNLFLRGQAVKAGD